MTPSLIAGRDFWLTSGFHLLQRDGAGRLEVTDDFIRAYLNRPEAKPVAESCPAEIALHRDLVARPREAVPPERVAKLADADARENYDVLLRFRDVLLRHGTLEASYLALFRARAADMPALFVNHLVHAILRNILDDCDDALQLRAAELLFRSQMVNLTDEGIMLADEETVEMYASRGPRRASPHLLDADAAPAREVELDVLRRDIADLYWSRSDRFDTVLNIGFGQAGLDALCRVLERWIGHFLGVEVTIHPVQAVRDERWAWHVGLDAEASGILNDLFVGVEVDDQRRRHLLTLYRMEFRDPAVMLAHLAGRPVYLGMAMTAENKLHLKPQNLLLNLPLAVSA